MVEILRSEPTLINFFPKSEQLIRDLNFETRNAFFDFFSSEQYRTILARQLLSGEAPKDTDKGYITDFMGYTFEHISYNWYRKKINSGRMLLSPEQTNKIYSYMYPGAEFRGLRSGLQLDMRGISIPDGLIIAKSVDGLTTNIVGATEYTSADLSKHREKRLQIIKMRKSVSRNLKPICDENQDLSEYFASIYPGWPNTFSVMKKLKIDIVLPQNRDTEDLINPEDLKRIPLALHKFGEIVIMMVTEMKCFLDSHHQRR